MFWAAAAASKDTCLLILIMSLEVTYEKCQKIPNHFYLLASGYDYRSPRYSQGRAQIRQRGDSRGFTPIVIVIDTMEVRDNKGFRASELKLLQNKVKEHADLIKEMWHEHFEEKED